jgi:hypothetical protein
MNFRRLLLGLLLPLLITFAISACGGEEPTPTPTPMPPPTPAPTAVLATAVPATQAAGGTTAPAQGGTLLDAMSQVKGAETYRVNISFTGKGEFLAAGGPTPAPGNEAEPFSLVSMTGEVNGSDAHYTLQGAMTAMLGIDPSNTFEVITAGGDAYLKGPVPLLGALEDKWYLVPAQAAGIAQPPLTPSAILDSFGQAGINPDDFKLSGTESIDGQNCEVYAGDKSAVVNAFSKIGGTAGATQEDLDSIDNAEFKFWVCPDGYLHQVKMLVEGHEKDDPSRTGSFEILMHISDFGADISIQAPTDAIPLQLPSQPPVEPALPTTTP